VSSKVILAEYTYGAVTRCLFADGSIFFIADLISDVDHSLALYPLTIILTKLTNKRFQQQNDPQNQMMTPKTCASLSTASTMLMNVKRVVQQGITHPFGDNRTVKQAFPAAIPSKESDPFLMCDYFDAVEKEGPAKNEDSFPVDWHPHAGFDIASYLLSGTGRHADSLGNRETYETPGMQWMSTGSGVEHAEGGASTKGELVEGFQIWINTPSDRKGDDPRYGTVPAEKMPLLKLGGDDQDNKSTARILAGEFMGARGPFETVQPVQMVDFHIDVDTTVSFDIADNLDTAMLYVYDGKIQLLSADNDQNTSVDGGHVVLFDADSTQRRGVQLTTPKDGKARAVLFTGKKLREPIAWHGPIVMNTKDQLMTIFRQIQTGQFPPKRVPWDYKRAASRFE
jgi:quercetin 2,3-dioxygenase